MGVHMNSMRSPARCITVRGAACHHHYFTGGGGRAAKGGSTKRSGNSTSEATATACKYKTAALAWGMGHGVGSTGYETIVCLGRRAVWKEARKGTGAGAGRAFDERFGMRHERGQVLRQVLGQAGHSTHGLE